MAARTAGIDRNEDETTSLSPNVLPQCHLFLVFKFKSAFQPTGGRYGELRPMMTLTLELDLDI